MFGGADMCMNKILQFYSEKWQDQISTDCHDLSGFRDWPNQSGVGRKEGQQTDTHAEKLGLHRLSALMETHQHPESQCILISLQARRWFIVPADRVKVHCKPPHSWIMKRQFFRYEGPGIMDFRLSPKDKKVLHVSWHLELCMCALLFSIFLGTDGVWRRCGRQEKTTLFHTSLWLRLRFF